MTREELIDNLRRAEEALRDIDERVSHSPRLIDDVRAILKWYWSMREGKD